MQIPFNKPFIAGRELEFIATAVSLGNISGDGEFTKRCSRILEELGARRILMTPSCTAALEMAAMLCGTGPGDEVIMPSYTFVSTANAFVREGARPVFVDIRPDTLAIDERRIEEAITPRTKAICPVHYAGVACEMDAIMEIAERHGVRVVEDAAQGVNAFYRGRALGSIGQLGAYSFHETKNFMSGEGGALCINDPALVERAEILRDKGTNRQRFFRGEVAKYVWVDIGSSYVPSEIVCAFLCGQLELMDQITERRRRIYANYTALLTPLVDRGAFRAPCTPDHCQSNYHMYYVLLENQRTRDRLTQFLGERGILSVFHYSPLHASPMGRRFGYRVGEFPITESASDRLLRLPLFYEMTEEEQEYVATSIREFFV